MKAFWKSLFILMVIAALTMGCGQVQEQVKERGNEQDIEQEINNAAESNSNQDTSIDESNLSPIHEPEPMLQRTITLYFSDHELVYIYKEDRIIEVKEESELPIAALQAWLHGPEQDDLHSIVPPEVIIEYVNDVDGVAHVSFSEEIKNANLGSSGEMHLIDQVVMIMQQFGYEQTQFLVEGEIVESVLGHMYTQEPLEAGNPDEYEYIH